MLTTTAHGRGKPPRRETLLICWQASSIKCRAPSSPVLNHDPPGRSCVRGVMSQPENPRTIRDTLRRIGYAAAFVSGSAAAVYTLSSALRRHDLSAIWMLDKSAAPPPAIQRELRGDPYGSDSDVSDEFPGRHVPRRCAVRPAAVARCAAGRPLCATQRLPSGGCRLGETPDATACDEQADEYRADGDPYELEGS